MCIVEEILTSNHIHKAPSSSDIIDPQFPINTAHHDLLAPNANARNTIPSLGEHHQRLPRIALDVPQANRSVIAARNNDAVAIPRESHSIDTSGMPLEAAHRPSGRYIPQEDGLVPTDRGEELVVGRDAQICYVVAMARVGLHETPRGVGIERGACRVEESDLAIGATCEYVLGSTVAVGYGVDRP